MRLLCPGRVVFPDLEMWSSPQYSLLGRLEDEFLEFLYLLGHLYLVSLSLSSPSSLTSIYFRSQEPRTYRVSQGKDLKKTFWTSSFGETLGGELTPEGGSNSTILWTSWEFQSIAPVGAVERVQCIWGGSLRLGGFFSCSCSVLSPLRLSSYLWISFYMNAYLGNHVLYEDAQVSA